MEGPTIGAKNYNKYLEYEWINLIFGELSLPLAFHISCREMSTNLSSGRNEWSH